MKLLRDIIRFAICRIVYGSHLMVDLGTDRHGKRFWQCERCLFAEVHQRVR